MVVHLVFSRETNFGQHLAILAVRLVINAYNESKEIYKHEYKTFWVVFVFFLSRWSFKLFWQNLQEGIGKKE